MEDTISYIVARYVSVATGQPTGNNTFYCCLLTKVNSMEMSQPWKVLLMVCCLATGAGFLSFFPSCNPTLFAICTNTFSKLCKQRIKQRAEGRSVALQNLYYFFCSFSAAFLRK
jgi:hypothetical protein